MDNFKKYYQLFPDNCQLLKPYFVIINYEIDFRANVYYSNLILLIIDYFLNLIFDYFNLFFIILIYHLLLIN